MPRDPSKLARAIIDIATGEAPPEPDPDAGKDPKAVERGRKGGLRGGKVRAAKMSPKARTAAARKAVAARWERRSR